MSNAVQKLPILAIQRPHGMIAMMALLLTACADTFTWEDPSTWRFKRTEKERQLYQMEQACLKTKAENRRVLLMNGVSGPAKQTECMPYSDGPLPPQRFEGR